MPEKMVKVRATTFGQKPDRSFAHVGDEFEIPESLVSKRWHVRLDGKGAEDKTADPGDADRAAKAAAALAEKQAAKVPGKPGPKPKSEPPKDPGLEAAAKAEADAAKADDAAMSGKAAPSEKPVIDKDA